MQGKRKLYECHTLFFIFFLPFSNKIEKYLLIRLACLSVKLLTLVTVLQISLNLYGLSISDIAQTILRHRNTQKFSERRITSINHFYEIDVLKFFVEKKSLILLLLLSAVFILHLVCSFHNSDLVIPFMIDFEFLYLAESNQY